MLTSCWHSYSTTKQNKRVELKSHQGGHDVG